MDGSTADRPVTGVERICTDPELLTAAVGTEGVRGYGILTNFTGTMPDLGRNIDALVSAGIPPRAILTPEHGLWGSAQAGSSEPSGVDEATAIPVCDTYEKSGDELDALLRDAGLTALVVDLQDCGVRFYTYIWSVFDAMVSAARLGLPVVVLDRPNPIASFPAQGPGLDPACASFVGRASIPLIHSLTIGELARRFNALEIPAQAGRAAELSVIPMTGWARTMPAEVSLRPWVAPSPNLPTPTAVRLYPGTCLFEGTNLSEGRGTTRPFECVGAGWVDAPLAPALGDLGLPGVSFRDIFFVPAFSKWSGQRVRGVQVHLLDQGAFDPLLTAVSMLQVIAGLYPSEFRFLEPTTASRPRSIELLWGSDLLRTRLHEDLPSLIQLSPRPATIDADIRLYA